MKTYKLILLQLLFFVLMSIITQYLKGYSLIKQVCYFTLIAALSYFIFIYFTKIESLLKGYLINLASLFLFFELKKASEYYLGLLSPKYLEVVFISMAISFTAIAFYLGFILIVYRLAKMKSHG